LEFKNSKQSTGWMGFGYGAGTGSGLKDAWMRFLNVFKLPKRVEIMLMLYVRVPKAANKLNMYLSFWGGRWAE